MLVEWWILSTLLQPDEPQTFLAYWAWELSMNTPGWEQPIRQEVMNRVPVPNIHLEGCPFSLVVCPYTFLPSTNQFIPQRLHVYECHWKVLGGHLLTCLHPCIIITRLRAWSHHLLSHTMCFTMVDPHDIVFGKSIVQKMSAHSLLANSPLVVTFCAGTLN
jgi:hypothetical protein